jgi:hypothetical protein
MDHFNDTSPQDLYVMCVPESMLFGQPMVDHIQQVLVFNPEISAIRIFVMDDNTRKIIRGRTLEVSAARGLHHCRVDQERNVYIMLRELLSQHSSSATLH